MLRIWLVAGIWTAAWAWSSTTRRTTGRCGTTFQSSVTSDLSHNQPRISEFDDIDDYQSRGLERNSRRRLMKSVPVLLMTTILQPTTAAATGQQRCYSDDPRCSADGTMRETDERKSIPRVTNQITHVAQITYTVGERQEEVGFIRIGLYGKDCPGSVKQLLLFLSSGLSTMSEEQRRDSIGMQTAPVGLLSGGIVPSIYLGTAVEFGVPFQSKAFAASRGMPSAGPDFVPQPRPIKLSDESFPRLHDVAGLVSIPVGGIGSGGSSFESDDEAFASAFLITADAAPLLDSGRAQHRVVGQVIDDASMANLARLASLPVQKGLKGIIPGQGSSPPLLKVTVQDVGVQKVK